MSRNGFFFLYCLLLSFILLSFVPQLQAAETGGVERSDAEIIRLGERLYRDGLLPSGEPMEAFIRDDISVDSTTFSCSSCHLRAGIGSFEGGVVTPPTTGKKLYEPYQRPPSLADVADSGGRYIYAKTITNRPAYTEESLAHAMRTGIDPGGQEFNDVMPRYPLADADMELLIQYLNRLSADFSPGATLQSLRFATIVTEEVSRDDRDALLIPLQRFIGGQNQQVEMYKDFIDFGFKPTGDMRFSFRTASLSVWELKGPPATWQAQLREYYRKDPVFAVLGGISYGDWQPIHDFCEKVRLPCLFPITNFPVVAENDWYTIYFNKGFYQEGEGAARYLHRSEDGKEKKILQLIEETPVGKALAAGFDQTWAELGYPPVKAMTLSKGKSLDSAALAALLAENNCNVLLLWADEKILPTLPALASGLAPPAMILVSSGALGPATATIAAELRSQVFITFPYRLTPYVGAKEGIDAKIPLLTTARSFADKRISSRTATMLTQVALQGLRGLYDNLYQDHLLDVMSMQMDQVVPDYERLSFGPGQRYAAKGCYVIQLGPGDTPELLSRSEWVTH